MKTLIKTTAFLKLPQNYENPKSVSPKKPWEITYVKWESKPSGESHIFKQP